jgi:hypothetical protein
VTTLPRPPHPKPYVRDDRETPLNRERDGAGEAGDLGQMEIEIFWQTELDAQSAKQPVGQIRCWRKVTRRHEYCHAGDAHPLFFPHLASIYRRPR